MNLATYEPSKLFRQFSEEANKALRGWPFTMNGNDDSRVVTSHWMPAVDIKEEEDRYVIAADLPGVDPKDIEVTLENGVLTLKGEHSWNEQKEKEDYRRIERVFGTFYRRFSLPSDVVDADKVEAKCHNGVLLVTVPKQEQARQRRIKVAA